MNIALAQVHMRLGDIEGICSRIEDQVALAHERGAQLLCVPAPLFYGVQPGGLIECANFEHDVLSSLGRLAERIAEKGVVCLVPAAVSLQGASLYDVLMLKEGRVVPLRLTALQLRGPGSSSLWAPPAFDVAGARVAVTFDAARDLSELPPGCDVAVYFQVDGFDMTDSATTAVAAVSDGAFREEVERSGVWLACMAPVGGYDDAVYTGGSFVMDDAGRVAAAAPCFEESLLTCEIERGMPSERLDAHTLPAFQREVWLWEALRLHLRDSVAASGMSRVMVPFAGDLSSSLLAVLAVDALGPRNVLGMLAERDEPATPAQAARERDRLLAARQVAESLGIRLIERSAPSAARLLDRDAPGAGSLRAQRGLEALLLAEAAREQLALPLSPLVKTAAALCPEHAAYGEAGALAPFGDVYLTELEFLARMRNRRSAALPASLVRLSAVEEGMAAIVDAAVGRQADAAYMQRMRALLSGLEPIQIDGVLEAHIDRNASFEDIVSTGASPEAVALLLMLVRRGEAARRRLPATPIVSARSLAERSWPLSLAWSDMGRHGAEAIQAMGLAGAECKRIEERGVERGQLARSEVMDFIGALLGLSPEQREELQSDEGQQRMREGMEQLERQMREAAAHMGIDMGSSMGQAPPGAMPGGFGFFSLN